MMLDSGFRILENKHPLCSLFDPFDKAPTFAKAPEGRQGRVSCGASNPRQCRGLTIWSGSGIYGSDEGGSRTAPTFGGKQIRATTWGCPYVEQRNGTVTVVRNIADYALGKLKIKM